MAVHFNLCFCFRVFSYHYSAIAHATLSKADIFAFCFSLFVLYLAVCKLRAIIIIIIIIYALFETEVNIWCQLNRFKHPT